MKTKLNRRLLKKLRAERGWSLAQAAATIGITRQALDYIERGVVQPRASTLSQIADTYRVGMGDLWGKKVAS